MRVSYEDLEISSVVIINIKSRWYFTKTNRWDAERFLERAHNEKGTFLIRPSDTNQGRVDAIDFQ